MRRYAGVALVAVLAVLGWWQSDLVVAPGNASVPEEYAFQLSGKVVHVADGDSFTLQVRGHRESIRMASIDAPETHKSNDRPGQPLAKASRRSLAALIQGKQLTVYCYERDHYQRSICDVPLAQGKTANQLQVMKGMAWANMEGRGKFMRDLSLPSLQEKARQQKEGLWKEKNQVQPWVWRYQCWKQKQC